MNNKDLILHRAGLSDFSGRELTDNPQSYGSTTLKDQIGNPYFTDVVKARVEKLVPALSYAYQYLRNENYSMSDVKGTRVEHTRVIRNKFYVVDKDNVSTGNRDTIKYKKRYVDFKDKIEIPSTFNEQSLLEVSGNSEDELIANMLVNTQTEATIQGGVEITEKLFLFTAAETARAEYIGGSTDQVVVLAGNEDDAAKTYIASELLVKAREKIIAGEVLNGFNLNELVWIFTPSFEKSIRNAGNNNFTTIAAEQSFDQVYLGMNKYGTFQGVPVLVTNYISNTTLEDGEGNEYIVDDNKVQAMLIRKGAIGLHQKIAGPMIERINGKMEDYYMNYEMHIGSGPVWEEAIWIIQEKNVVVTPLMNKIRAQMEKSTFELGTVKVEAQSETVAKSTKSSK